MRLSHRWYTTSGLLYRPPARGRISHAHVLNPDVIAAGDVHQRFLTGIAVRDDFAALVRCQLTRTAEQHAMCLGALAVLAGAGNDQVALELGQPAQYRQDQLAVRRLT
jgi:hypothetical protein